MLSYSFKLQLALVLAPVKMLWAKTKADLLRKFFFFFSIKSVEEVARLAIHIFGLGAYPVSVTREIIPLLIIIYLIKKM